MRKMKMTAVLLAGLLAAPLMSWAADVNETLARLQSRWAEVNYQLPEKQREAAFAELAAQAETEVRNNPAPELLIWRGIILSTYAGAKGGLGALDLVKASKASLEQALAKNDQALEGSAYTSLGALYYQVPGWPVGFGDDDKAEQLLKQALAINPTGIDPNFFYGDFLLDQGDKAQAMLSKALTLNPEGIDPNYFYGDFLYRQERYADARVALLKAQAAKPRPGREVADRGRQAEIQALLDKVAAELK